MSVTSAFLAEVYGEAQNQHRAQRFAEAEKLYRRVVEADDGHRGAWHHLGLVSLGQNKLAEAAECFERVLRLVPNHVDALTQMGIVLARQEKLKEAIPRFRKAIELRPENAKAHNNLGVALTQLGKRDEGLACYKEAVRLQPDYAEAQFNLALALADRKQADEAIGCYKRALQIRPDYSEALFNLGLLLVSERRAAEAVVLLEQAVRFKPDNPEAHNNLALALADLGRLEESIASCDAALRLRPLDAKTHMNRANALASVGKVEEALACYDFALSLQPDYVNARWNRSLAWLSEGDFERGWHEYEWRWKKPETKSRRLPRPRWEGEPLQGKTIFLWCEQGVGDTLQFVRYAALLKAKGATVWQECPAHLVPLLSTCRSIDRVLAEGGPPLEFDCHAPLMSLPLHCRTTLDTVPAATPYLFADPQATERWQSELGEPEGLKIGVTWQGNPKHRWDRHRSFSVQWFRSLAMLEGVKLYSLQKGKGTEQLPAASFPIVDLRPRLDKLGGGFEQTAAAIEALDLIVTCDSAVAHLAGAVGKPVWVPMSALADWRWLRHREDSPWYPTMKLFRQTSLGQWGPVFDRICAEAGSLARQRAPRLECSPPKVLGWPALLHLCAKARAVGKKIVWTNGCFDLLHVGHIRSLQAARRFGDMLVVGVNSDASVGRLKGPGRPIVPQSERCELLASLACVDYVVVFDEDTPVEAVERLQPDVHCKGADYAPPRGKPVPEAPVVQAYGGRIEYLPMAPGNSTSGLIERIRGEDIGDTVPSPHG